MLWVFYMVGYAEGINAALAEKDLFSINEVKNRLSLAASLECCDKLAVVFKIATSVMRFLVPRNDRRCGYLIWVRCSGGINAALAEKDFFSINEVKKSFAVSPQV